MKALIWFILCSSFAGYGGLIPSIPSTYTDVTTYNTHVVYKSGNVLILRGSTPQNLDAILSLKNHGIDQILIFKNESKDEVASEIADLKVAGFQSHQMIHIPMPWRDFSSFESQCQMTLDGLSMISTAIQNQKSLYFHCTVGEDRTGLLSALWMLWSLPAQNPLDLFFTEMCAKGYEAAEKQKPPYVVENIRKFLTPFYFKMAEKIHSAKNQGKALSQIDCVDAQEGLPQLPEPTCAGAL